MTSFFRGFKVDKIKPALKMSMQRIDLLKNKKTVGIKKSKRQVAELLRDGKVEKARIATEHIVREDFLLEAYDIIELLCEVVLERIRLLEAEKECPFDMREAVCTLIYCANRTEIKELTQVKEQLVKKFGKDFAARAMNNHNGCVNERIVHKLSAQPPNAFLVLNYMKELAAEYNIDWQPDETTAMTGSRFDTAMAPPSGMSVEAGVGSGLGAAAYRYTDGRILPPGQRPTNFDPQADQGGSRSGGGGSGPAGGAGSGPGGEDDDGDEFVIPTAYSVGGAGLANGRGGAGGRGGNGGGGGGGAAVAQVVDDKDSGFDFDSIPSAPSSKPGRRSVGRGGGSDSGRRGGGGGGGGGNVVDDPSTYGKDDEEVPAFDELTARFNALKKG